MSVKMRIGDNFATFSRGTWSSADQELQEILQVATDVRVYEALPSDPTGLEHVHQVARDYGGQVVEVTAEPGSIAGRVY